MSTAGSTKPSVVHGSDGAEFAGRGFHLLVHQQGVLAA